MSDTVGTVSLKLEFDKKSIVASQTDVTKTVESKWKDLGSNLTSAATKVGKAMAVGIAGATAGITAITKSAVEAFADYEQLVGGVETLFKESAPRVQSYAETAFKTAGLSANDYMETVTSFSASLLQSVGNDTEKAADYADQAITDMSDNANKMGTSMESIQWAYQGFAKQNYTMLDNLKLGYGGTKEEMQRLIEDANKVKKANGEMANLSIDSFADVTEAIHIIQTEMGITGTTAEEADKTISGSMNSMKAAWQNMLVGISDPDSNFTALIDNLVQSVSTFGQNILPVIQYSLEGVGLLVEELAPAIVDALPKLINDVLPGLIDAAIGAVDSIVAALPQILPTIIDALVDIVVAIVPQIPSILLYLVNAVIDAIPYLIQSLTAILPQLVQAITQLTIGLANALTNPTNLSLILQAGLQLLMELVKAIPQILTSLYEAMPQIIQNIVGFLTDPDNIGMIMNAAATLFFALVSAVPQILGALLGAFGSLLGSLWEWIKSNFGSFAASFGEFIGGIFKNAINGVISFIENFINTPINIINGFIDTINNAFGAVGVNIGRITPVSLPRLAQGGLATSATAALIGEEGREAVLPLDRNTGNWSGLLADSLIAAMDERDQSFGGGITVYMTNEINSQLDIREVGRGLEQELRRLAR